METQSPSVVRSAGPSVEPIRKTLRVEVPVEVAFRVFAQEMSKWWDLETHHIGAVKALEIVVEPKTGGRWYERGADGSECNWDTFVAATSKLD